MDDLGRRSSPPELVDLLVRGVADELDGVDQGALVATRDTLLLQLLTAKAAASDLP